MFVHRMDMLNNQIKNLKLPFATMILVLFVCFTVPSCIQHRTGEEQQTVVRLEPVSQWLGEFFLSNSYYPESIEELIEWKGLPLPVNPYNGKTMVSLTTSEFDVAVSPGNFFYETVKISGQSTSYLLSVFGEDGLIIKLNPNVRWDNIRDEFHER